MKSSGTKDLLLFFFFLLLLFLLDNSGKRYRYGHPIRYNKTDKISSNIIMIIIQYSSKFCFVFFADVQCYYNPLFQISGVTDDDDNDNDGSSGGGDSVGGGSDDK